ncbi:unnamed protein product [Closterium sp. NIES-65]|nr:unnamed protein product [Closterium sp. NIES-65]
MQRAAKTRHFVPQCRSPCPESSAAQITRALVYPRVRGRRVAPSASPVASSACSAPPLHSHASPPWSPIPSLVPHPLPGPPYPPWSPIPSLVPHPLPGPPSPPWSPIPSLVPHPLPGPPSPPCSTLEEVRLLQQQRSRLNSTAPSPFPPPPPLPPHLPHLSSLQPRARGSPPAAAAARAPVLMSALEEVRLLQQQRVRLKGIAADGALTGAEGAEGKGGGAGAQGEAGEEGEGGEELVLQDTFAQETAITVEDPNMLKCIEEELAKRRGGAELSHMPQLKYIEEELAKRRGDVALKYIEEELAKRRGGGAGAAGGSRGEGEGEDEVLRAEDKLYEIPQHLQVGKLEGEEGGTAWTTGIAEVQLPIDYKLGNIEATEEAKRMLHHLTTTPSLSFLPSPVFSSSPRPSSQLQAGQHRGHGGGQAHDAGETAVDEPPAVWLVSLLGREKERGLVAWGC